jgi:hypothetical protein
MVSPSPEASKSWAVAEAPPVWALPDAWLRRFRIKCIPLRADIPVPEVVQRESEDHAVVGLRLVSTFLHDGHVFLTFTRL